MATIDERLDRLIERHEAPQVSIREEGENIRELRQTVREQGTNIDKMLQTLRIDGENIARLARIAESRENRISGLEGSNG